MLQQFMDKETLASDWLVLGDSVSKGIVLDEERGRYQQTAQSFIDLVAGKVGATVKNLSMFGATVKKGISLLDRHKQDLPSSGLAILEFGGNDCDYLWPEISENPVAEHQPNVPFENFQNLYKELIRKVRDIGLTPVLVSLPPLDADRYFDTLSRKLNKENVLKWLNGTTRTIYQWHEAYNATIADLALEMNALYVDIRQPFLLSGKPQDYICSDGIHPNERGHNLIADFLAKRLSIYTQAERA